MLLVVDHELNEMREVRLSNFGGDFVRVNFADCQ
jgi:hypothetical protein